MKHKYLVCLLCSALFVFGTTTAWAADHDNNAHIEGIIIGTDQIANHSTVNGQDVNNEANGQFYMMGTLDMGPGTWHMEVRGSTTPPDHGVSATYPGVNASMGETLDSSGGGRIAVTQFFYELPVGPGKFRVGLLDPTALLDANPIANDEYTQFLGGPFVNNPSIGFPSFVLGGAYQGTIGKHLDYKAFVSSSSGLEEDNHTYSNVVHMSDDGKGAFAAGELGWHTDSLMVKGGLWYDTSDHLQIGHPGHTEDDYGAYALVGGPAGPGHWDFRAGIANDKAQADANFLSLAYAMPIRDTTLGGAISRRGDSSDLPFDSDPIYQAEVYWRVHVYKTAYITPDLQYVINPSFHANEDDALVAGVRVGVGF